jgi:hypothetical protein
MLLHSLNARDSKVPYGKPLTANNALFLLGRLLEELVGTKNGSLIDKSVATSYNEIEENMKFFHFSQNNSFGRFEGPHNLVVEAESATDANERAQDWGVYFDGVESGLDCPCCGDRWYELWEGESGKDFPHVWGELVCPIAFKTNTLIIYANGFQMYAKLLE